MADYKISGERLTSIANAIRGKTGKEDSLTLEQMVTEIEGIEAGGGKPVFESILTDKIANHIVSVIEFELDSTLEDTTPPPPPGTYYNGVKLPELPADTVTSYPYCWIRKDTGTGYYELFMAEGKWYAWDNGGDEINVMGHEDGKYIRWYRIAISTAETADAWEYYQQYDANNFGFTGNRSFVWSSHDIPSGSADATEIYFKGSDPVIGE